VATYAIYDSGNVACYTSHRIVAGPAIVINAFRDGTRSDSSEPLLTGVLPVPKGETMGGRFFSAAV
jgi:hypothetical protein